MRDFKGDRLATDEVLGEALAEPIIQTGGRMNGDFAFVNQSVDFGNGDGGNVERVRVVSNGGERSCRQFCWSSTSQ